jgi:hypothetical protein
MLFQLVGIGASQSMRRSIDYQESVKPVRAANDWIGPATALVCSGGTDLRNSFDCSI